MTTQLYLSHQVQTHFELNPFKLKKDTETILAFDWRAMWRCELLISTESNDEHVFIFTNAVTRYSILLVERDHEIHNLLHAFHEQLIALFGDTLESQDFDQWLMQLDLLSDSATSLDDQMRQIADLSITQLGAHDADISAAEHAVNNVRHDLTSPMQRTQSQLSHSRRSTIPRRKVRRRLPKKSL
ncbi:hypothetical protein [Rubritalea marina]|uniref:hypothetical protein n=1 Tax=Rubritalea marina TaxID=361055 RepID=UPI0003770DE9|nr:hypothetical protein [Rubritalea marina]